MKKPLTRNEIFHVTQAEASKIIASVTSSLELDLNESETSEMRKSIATTLFWKIANSQNGEERLKEEIKRIIETVKEKREKHPRKLRV